MHDRPIPEQVRKALEEFTSMKEYAFVVEGIKDENALRSCSFDKKYIFLLTNGNETAATEILGEKYKKAIILTDYDKSGYKREKSLKPCLIGHSIEVDDYQRKHFHEIFRVETIEEMKRYAKILELELYNS